MRAASRPPAPRDTSPSVPSSAGRPRKPRADRSASFVFTPQSKMLKCADNEDIITMTADDAGDVVTFMFESPGTPPIARRTSHATRDPEPGRRSRHRLASGFSNSAAFATESTKVGTPKRRRRLILSARPTDIMRATRPRATQPLTRENHFTLLLFRLRSKHRPGQDL
jgi:hypothetical protein